MRLSTTAAPLTHHLLTPAPRANLCRQIAEQNLRVLEILVPPGFEIRCTDPVTLLDVLT